MTIVAQRASGVSMLCRYWLRTKVWLGGHRRSDCLGLHFRFLADSCTLWHLAVGLGFGDERVDAGLSSSVENTSPAVYSLPGSTPPVSFFQTHMPLM